MCHHNHEQEQVYPGKYNQEEFFIATGTRDPSRPVEVLVDPEGNKRTVIPFSDLAATKGSSKWAADLNYLARKTELPEGDERPGRGAMLVPDVSTSSGRWQVYMICLINLDPDGNPETDDGTITIKGELGELTDFRIFYGQQIRSLMFVKSELRFIEFFDIDGDYSFTNNSATGICQVCHEDGVVSHWTNTGSDGMGHNPDRNCMTCHSHTNGFAHCAEESTACNGCHYTDSPDAPETYCSDALVKCSDCHHTGSHGIHLDQDDPKGPAVLCDACHDMTNYPYFKSGTDGNGDYMFDLSETDVCDTCHSPGGTYDGVNDPDLGVKYGNSGELKYNWLNGVNDADGTNLKPGMEKWCATCHDEEPALIKGVYAPNIIGNEDATIDDGYVYGNIAPGWGFYKTGHGLPAEENYASKGGIKTLSGRPVQCSSCHDYSAGHIDGLARTFDCGPTGDRLNCDATEYRTSYRLKLVDGEEPMIIPWSTRTPKRSDASYFRLCAECHVSEPFTDAGNTHTNFYTWRTLNGDARWTNRHNYHLGLWTFTSSWPADYLFTYGDDGKLNSGNSRPTCVTCHNVHGSTNLAMIRDGKLIDREPGQQIRYFDENTTAVPAGGWYQWPADPEDVTLADSNGTFWKGSSATNLCAHCHAWPSQFDKRCEPVDIIGDDPDLGVEPDCASYVQPFQTTDLQTLGLEWTGENGYVSDGVEPDSGFSGEKFTFRVKVTSDYPELPWTIQLWIDKDDDGSYENIDNDPADEKIDLTELDPYDDDYTDGKFFTVDVTLDKAGDNSFTYRFYGVGAWEDVVELPSSPGPDLTVNIMNNLPVLSWTEGTYFESDGVHPDTGGNGADYQFRVMYTDADDQCPASIQFVVTGIAGTTNYNLTDHNGTDCDAGRIYYRTITLNSSSPPEDLTYYFTATDDIDNATGSPTENNTLTVLADSNTPPLLDWVTGDCLTQGVKPALGLATGDFEFKVRYTDPDGTAPSSINVWVDLNDNDIVDGGEEQDLTWVDDGDENYTDGEIFTYIFTIDEADAGEHEFIFSASDGTDTAVGEPAVADTNRTVTIKSTTEGTDKFKGVRQGSGDTGPVWYNSIQDAIDPSGSLSYQTTILVYEGTYNENIVLDRALTNPSGDSTPRDNNIILQSVCGPAMTTIQGRDNDSNGEPDGIAVHFNGIYETDPVIDGFTVTGGTEGIVFFHANPIVKNCIIEGNGRGIRSSNDIGVLTLVDSTIQNNVGTLSGAGISLVGGYDIHGVIPQHTISGCVIRNNQTTGGSGGGICLVNSGSGKGLTIKDTTISGNKALSGGGIYLTYSKLDMDYSTLSANASTGTGIWDGGGGLYMKESSSVSIVNSNVVDNSSYQYGAGIHLWGPNVAGNLNMINCTVSNNGMTDAGSGNGGGMYNAGSNVSVHNSIVWNNRAGSGHEIFNGYGTTSVTWSDVLNNSDALYINNGSITTDANCIEADPFFVDSDNGDYHLKPISPAIDSGTSAGAPADDLDGDARPASSGFDMGSDEYVN